MKTETPHQDYLLSLTGLRGMSCLMVILCHCSNLQVEPSDTFSEFGTPAVYFFFVLSGYLLMSRGLAEIQPSRGDAPKRFFGEKLFYFSIKRIARIYPAYLVAVLLYYGMIWLVKHYHHWEFILQDFDRPILASLYFQGMESHFWTIANEWYFYTIVLPIILCVAAELMILDHKFFRGYKRFSLAVPFYLLLTAYITYQQYQIGNVETGYPYRYDFKVHLPAFWHGTLGGIASYYARYYYKIHLKMNFTPIKKWIAELIVWALLLRLALGNLKIMSLYTNWDPQVWWNNPLAVTPFVAALLFVLDITRDTTSLARAMSLPLFKKMGEVSYSVYLMHVSVIVMFKWLTTIRGIDGTLNIILIAFLVGAVMYHLIEEKGVAYGNRFVKYLIKNDVKRDLKNLKPTHVELAEEVADTPPNPSELIVTVSRKKRSSSDHPRANSNFSDFKENSMPEKEYLGQGSSLCCIGAFHINLPSQ
jgi:peptidoglycan/LPS O-acetylase OafA/YrhL